MESLSHEATPAPADVDTNPSASVDVNTNPSAPADVDTTSSASTVEFSDYEKERESNIARNNQLLHELGLGKGASNLFNNSSKKGKGKKTK